MDFILSPNQTFVPVPTYIDAFRTWRCGPFLLGEMFQVNTNNAGWMSPLLKCLEDKDGLGKNLADPDKFNCRIPVPIHKRESHDINKKVGLGYPTKGSLYRICLVACPDKNFVASLSKYKDGDEGLLIEKLFRDECERIMLKTATANSKKRTTYAAWDPPKHSITSNPNKGLDHYITDEAVGTVIESYCIAKDFPKVEVYEYFKEKNISCFYSRSEKTGDYSTYCQERYGYPSNKREIDDLDSDSDSEIEVDGNDSDSAASGGDTVRNSVSYYHDSIYYAVSAVPLTTYTVFVYCIANCYNQ